MPSGVSSGDAVTLEDREIADVHQVVALPGVAVCDQDVDAVGGHRRGEFGAAFRAERCGFQIQTFTGTKRVVYMFFGSSG